MKFLILTGLLFMSFHYGLASHDRCHYEEPLTRKDFNKLFNLVLCQQDKILDLEKKLDKQYQKLSEIDEWVFGIMGENLNQSLALEKLDKIEAMLKEGFKKEESPAPWPWGS